MSRSTLITVLLIVVSLLLAVALFIAGAIWRGRVTTRSVATDSKISLQTADLPVPIRRHSQELSEGFIRCAWLTGHASLTRIVEVRPTTPELLYGDGTGMNLRSSTLFLHFKSSYEEEPVDTRN